MEWKETNACYFILCDILRVRVPATPYIVHIRCVFESIVLYC